MQQDGLQSKEREKQIVVLPPLCLLLMVLLLLLAIDVVVPLLGTPSDEGLKDRFMSTMAAVHSDMTTGVSDLLPPAASSSSSISHSSSSSSSTAMDPAQVASPPLTPLTAPLIIQSSASSALLVSDNVSLPRRLRLLLQEKRENIN